MESKLPARQSQFMRMVGRALVCDCSFLGPQASHLLVPQVAFFVPGRRDVCGPRKEHVHNLGHYWMVGSNEARDVYSPAEIDGEPMPRVVPVSRPLPLPR